MPAMTEETKKARKLRNKLEKRKRKLEKKLRRLGKRLRELVPLQIEGRDDAPAAAQGARKAKRRKPAVVARKAATRPLGKARKKPHVAKPKPTAGLSLNEGAGAASGAPGPAATR